jgi:hypothetical protein
MIKTPESKNVDLHEKLTTTPWKRFVRWLASTGGFICIPEDYPVWVAKSATDHLILSRWPGVEPDYAAEQRGMSRAYGAVAEEMKRYSEL